MLAYGEFCARPSTSPDLTIKTLPHKLLDVGVEQHSEPHISFPRLHWLLQSCQPCVPSGPLITVRPLSDAASATKDLWQALSAEPNPNSAATL